MTENLEEQTSESIAEVTTNAKEMEIPSHVIQCHDLLKSTKDYEDTNIIEPRCFYLTDSRVFFGIVFFESTDSFLVGAPVRMVFNNNKIEPDTIFPVNITRIFKSNVLAVTKPLDLVKYHYFLYIQTEGPKLLPDFVTKEKLEGISEYIKEYLDKEKGSKAKVLVDAEIEPATSPGVYNSTKAGSATHPSVYQALKDMLDEQKIEGTSEFAFSPFHISEKIQ